ncbi:MAG: universal stress protein [Pseudomonadota bacterium]
MFKNILVPLDLSKRNKKSLDIAVTIALSDNSKVHLLHVVETIADTTYAEFKDFYLKLEKRAQKYMDSMITPYQNRRMKIEWKVVFGNRVQEILKFAAEHKIDLIVMHSHKVNLKNPAEGWGTISYKVGILSQCPVMLVK